MTGVQTCALPIYRTALGIDDDPACNYCGGSAIIDAYGRTMAECERGKECEVSAEIDMEKLQAFREKFPVLKDAD